MLYPTMSDGSAAGIIAEQRRHPLSQRFHDLLKEIADLHDRKQSDYGRANDPFANVRGSLEWGVRPWVGAMIRANDKIKRLQKYAQTGTLANEGVTDSFQDLAVYALIGLVLCEEEQAQLPRVGDSLSVSDPLPLTASFERGRA